VVDLACGDGALLCAAAQVGDWRLIGVDVDPDAVAIARNRLAGARIHCGDGLRHPLASPGAVIGNPPFLFGEDRPKIDTAGFTLAAGQWDMAWLFVERAFALLSPGGRFGFVLPDAVLARHETERLRQFIARRASVIGIRHDEPAFVGAQVSTVLLWGEVGRGEGLATLEMDGRRWELGSSGPWPPPPEVMEGWECLGDHVHISRGEELGKRGLDPIEGGGSGVRLVSGDGVTPLGQPRATHLAHESKVNKRDALFLSPKIVVVKTGRRVKAGVDLEGLRTLQSVYNLCPHDRSVPWTRYLCGLLMSDEVHRRFIQPYTAGKKIFPQITQKMLAQVRFPHPSPQTVRQMALAVERTDLQKVNELVGRWSVHGPNPGG
jgi:predicted RNA methylase